MILYHFTTRGRWGQIERDGLLKPTDSGLHRDPATPTSIVADGNGRYVLARIAPGGRVEPATDWVERDEPPAVYDLLPPDHDLGTLVVHLTSDHRDCSSVQTDKLAVRIAVDVADAHPWVRWMRRHGVDDDWLRAGTVTPATGMWWSARSRGPNGSTSRRWRTPMSCGREVS